MRILSNIKWFNTKLIKVILSLILALVISLLLTLLFVIYHPSTFKNALNTSLELLPKHKFTSFQVSTKLELAQQWQMSDLLSNEQALFDQLKQNLPYSRNKSTFFARIFVVQDYPNTCQVTVFAMHKTMDVALQLKALRCHNPLSCQQAKELQICNAPKGNAQ